MSVWLISNEAGRSQKAKSVGMPRACMLLRALMTAPANSASTTTSSTPWRIRPRQNGSFQIFGFGAALGVAPAVALMARLTDQRIGGAYCRPLFVQSALRPRWIFNLEPAPTLRSKTSP